MFKKVSAFILAVMLTVLSFSFAVFGTSVRQKRIFWTACR